MSFVAERRSKYLIIGHDYGQHHVTAMDSIINRYYDPTTDQFLSIDPEVAETGQPYLFSGDDPLNAEDPLGLGAAANNALTAAIAALGARLTAYAKNPSAANLAAVNALRQRVNSDSVIVNTEDAAAVKSASEGSTTSVPSEVAKAESQQAQAQSCENKASGTVVKWGVTGSVVAAGGGTTDFLEVLGISVAPEWFGMFMLGTGAAIIVGGAGYGVFQASRC